MDTSPADWITTSAVPWQRLVEFGPSGFPAYARLRYLPDPADEGQSENDTEDEGDQVSEWRAAQWAAMFQVLALHTATADDCYVCVWDGYADHGPTPASCSEPDESAFAVGAMPLRYPDVLPPGWRGSPVPAVAPATLRQEPKTPRVIVAHRAYFLFHTSVTAAGAWDGSVELWVEEFRLRAPELAFVWPADHAWCVAFDVDPHWAGIGADNQVIDQLVSDTRLDAVSADPCTIQPHYRRQLRSRGRSLAREALGDPRPRISVGVEVRRGQAATD